MTHMNWKQIALNWADFRAGIKEQWSKINDGHLDAIAGSREKLIGSIRKAYGTSQEQVEKQVTSWTKRVTQQDPP
ncbi:general stress protein CsbD [Usitatibacter palustris]|uniref:CsbD-like n=1 Tax=Usitatibacter palustris TaxID=2732487 RepID=A0A6M4HFA4_9PROT|nr:general stress protein CsbD [Usitatibacter palustris]QJR16727.1 hypothetical protein DSM104440_03563 [Usitatibacter palustris]